MIEFDEYKVKLNNIRPRLDALADSLGIEAAKEEIDRLHAQIDSEGFWDDQEISQKVMKQSRTLEAKVARYEKMCSQWDDLYTLCEMALEDNDDSMLPELTEGYAQLEQEMENARLETLLSGEYDNNNAIVSFQAGAGGTEAQDWASMLYRMYTHWTEQHGLTYKILDYLDGDEAGIKSASILVEGENAYGMLKSENGVHRLVRVSPFDANARRQTSLAAVEVIPESTDDSKDVEIRPEDIEMQVYRSSGAGGQHINKTSSAVRLIHKPTGIVVTPSMETEVQYLSGGNQQKVVIAKWLFQNSEILFLDEPTRGIDVGAKAEIYRLINRMAKEGKTIIMISSEMPELLGMCDRIMVMHEGHKMGELNAAEATQAKIMALCS